MNMQAMLKQVQKMQKEMEKTQEEINNTEFEGKSSFVTVIMTGNKRMKSVKFNENELEKDDLEMLGDMIIIATNDALSKIEKTTEEKMGTLSKSMPKIPGLF